MENASRSSAARSNMSGAGSNKQGAGNGSNKQRKFDRVLSSKAIQIGHEHGITAEFICKQTAE